MEAISLRTLPRRLLLVLAMTQLLSACATGKPVNSANAIKDDGKSNIVTFTYDITLDATEKYATVNSTKLYFRCPESEGIDPGCFSFKVPYIGQATKANYTAHEFKRSGASTLKMKYGEYDVQKIHHAVVVNKIPKVNCYTSKKTKKRVCNTRLKDEHVYHTAALPESINFSVENGSGCYLGHLKLTMHNNVIVAYDFKDKIPLTADVLNKIDPELQDSVRRHVTRPC